MPLVAAAVCPHPPLIVPELAGAAAPELDELRTACDAAVAGLLDSGAHRVVVVGDGPETRSYGFPFHGSLAPWGADVEVRLGSARPGERPDPLPLSLTIGAWLLRRSPTGPSSVARMHSLAADVDPADCAALGGGYRADVDWGLLVLGDGSACRGPKSPGYDDPRAEAYDDGVARALADADAEALLDLDPALSTELKAAGRAPWQVLAGAVRAAGGQWRGELRHYSAPYGVAYFVASWERV
ncbi:class III extradiol dioxygenase subunit B-like domain-containing protein [Micromonospora coxensis]|uniref:class III extradiol dioxygenase subunit B-like domain-containing protein n=1 Tax=Micromonospora coxensis TaxID=356852 RepID=UPI0034354739